MNEKISYEEEIVLNVRKIMRAIDMYSSEIAQQYGLTTPQLICLKILDKSKSAITPGAIAKAAHLSDATVTGIINRLEKKGLIIRKRNVNDGRSFLIDITKTGATMIKSVPYMLQEYFIEELSKLANWEKTQILSSLQRITSILSVESIKVAPVLTTGSVEAPAEKISEFLNKTNGGTPPENKSKKPSGKSK
jgi:DNA-binding MarR family transcriptional regulator